MDTLVPVGKLTNSQVAEMRDYAEKVVRAACLWQPYLKHSISVRARNILRRAYLHGELKKPLNKLTNGELAAVRGVGVKTLAAIKEAMGNEQG